MEKNMQNKEKIWTEELVVAAFEEAIRTIKKLPSAKLRDYFTSWPQVVYSEIEIIRMDQRPKKWPATPEGAVANPHPQLTNLPLNFS